MTPDRRRFLQLTAAAAGAPLLRATPVAAAAPQLLRVLMIKTDGVKTLLWAQQQQLFEKHGLTVNVVPMQSGAATLPALIGGSGEIGAGSLFPMFAAFARGIPLKLVAPASLYLSDHADSLLLVRSDSPIRSARDLNGKIIGVDSLNDVYTLATKAWVDQGGGDGSSVKPVELPAAEDLPALEAGRIDAGIFKTPFGSIALDTGKVRLLGKPLDAIAPSFLLSAWVATADFVAKNASAVSEFQSVMADAGRYTNGHEDATVDLIATFTGQDPAQVRSSVRATTAITCSLAQLQQPLDFAYKYQLIPKQFDVREMLAPGFPLSG